MRDLVRGRNVDKLHRCLATARRGATFSCSIFAVAAVQLDCSCSLRFQLDCSCILHSLRQLGSCSLSSRLQLQLFSYILQFQLQPPYLALRAELAAARGQSRSMTDASCSSHCQREPALPLSIPRPVQTLLRDWKRSRGDNRVSRVAARAAKVPLSDGGLTTRARRYPRAAHRWARCAKLSDLGWAALPALASPQALPLAQGTSTSTGGRREALLRC